MAGMDHKKQTPAAFRIPSLDGLRALSITLVLLSHAILALPADVELPNALEPIVHNGHLGVSIFFVISGYLITLLLVREWKAYGSIHLGKFYGRRALRIFPPFYSYLAVVFVLSAAGLLHIPARLFLKAGLYTWNYNIGQGQGNWFLNHFWSLSLEEQFYLLWPAILVLARPRGAAKVAVILICLSPFLRILTYVLWPAARGSIGGMFHTASDKLMFGCAAALWYDSARFQRLLQRLDRCAVPLVAAAFLFVISPHLASTFRGAYGLPIGYSLEGAAITLLLLWLVRHPDTFIGKVFNYPPIKHIGVISYSLYIWQQLFLTPSPSNASSLSAWLLRILACFAVAECSYWGIERPFLALKAYFERPTADHAVSVSGPPDMAFNCDDRDVVVEAAGQALARWQVNRPTNGSVSGTEVERAR
jgi:peptidoglycan/LPS O-acetylase OafA/YrhL